MRRPVSLAGLGIVAICLATVTNGHLLQVEWHTTVPVPVGWWALAAVLEVAGPLMLFAAYGLTADQRQRWVAGTLFPPALYGLSALAVVALVRWRQPGVPPPGSWLLLAIAAVPVASLLVRRAPTWAVLPAAGLLVALAVTTGNQPVAAAAAFLVGFRYRGLAAVGAAGRSALGAVGRSAPAVAFLLPPVTVAANFLLRRLSALSAGPQIVLAVIEPVLLTLVIVALGVAVWSRIPRDAGPSPRVSPPPPSWRAAAGLLTVAVLTAGVGLARTDLARTDLARTGPAQTPADATADVTLAFAGDVHFEGRASALLDHPESAFGPAARDLASADVTLLNLETPITGRGRPEPKRYLFRTDPRAVTALRAAGVDAVSLANNHTLDYGRDGLADTIAAARAGDLGVFGAGRDADAAFTPWRTTVRGVRIAVFGFSQVDDLAASWAATPTGAGLAMAFDEDRAAAAVTAARRDSDLVVVMPHWGTEGAPCPNQAQQEFAHRLVEAGADVIVGAHAHVLQGTTRIGGGFVAYGLGNFLWYSSGLYAPFSARAGVLTLRVHARTVTSTRFTPTVVGRSGRPEPLTGWRADLARRHYDRLSTCSAAR